MSKASWVFVCFTLTACASAEQKPVWTVKASTASQQKIWVSKADGSRQCTGKKGAISSDFALRELKAAGVLAFQAKTGTDGQMRTQNCGAPTGNTVEVEISRIDIKKALERGYVTKETEAQ